MRERERKSGKITDEVREKKEKRAERDRDRQRHNDKISRRGGNVKYENCCVWKGRKNKQREVEKKIKDMWAKVIEPDTAREEESIIDR